mmetsp:Transcript_11678/g.35049  ORF Transcript_11678/g.35049 Transcript_11678/m.35049 type:complete len:257 (-) Transcript_11678:1492-2262(-)
MWPCRSVGVWTSFKFTGVVMQINELHRCIQGCGAAKQLHRYSRDLERVLAPRGDPLLPASEAASLPGSLLGLAPPGDDRSPYDRYADGGSSAAAAPRSEASRLMARELAALWEVATSRICIASSSLSSVKYAPKMQRPQGIQPNIDSEKAACRPIHVISSATSPGPAPRPRSSRTTCSASATPRVSGSLTFIIIALIGALHTDPVKPAQNTRKVASSTDPGPFRGALTTYIMLGTLRTTHTAAKSGMRRRRLVYSF